MANAVETARAQWAVRIAGAWRKSVEAILGAGRLLTPADPAKISSRHPPAPGERP